MTFQIRETAEPDTDGGVRDATPPLRGVLVLAMTPPLVYCGVILYFLEGRLPRPGPWLILTALAAAVLGVGARRHKPRGTAARIFTASELLVRYCLALLLIQFALNKLVPGQFLLYNGDLDLQLRELPGRRLAWHFLGYSRLYNGFIAAVELLAGGLLCSRRTLRGGVLLGLSVLVNIVVIDVAFGIRGALPIATVMACSALALAVVHLDWRTLQPFVWSDERPHRPKRSPRHRLAWLVALTIVFGLPLYMNVGTRRGLDAQVPPAGRWEILACRPSVPLAICQAGQPPAVLYLEVGQWGQLATAAGRRRLSFRYDRASRSLSVRIPVSDGEPDLALDGVIDEGAATVSLVGRTAGVPPFHLQARRTRPAPWPPARAF